MATRHLPAVKPGMSLALRLLADDLDESISWLADRYDYCAEKGKNPEAMHADTLARVQSELKRLSREAEKGDKS